MVRVRRYEIESFTAGRRLRMLGLVGDPDVFQYVSSELLLLPLVSPKSWGAILLVRVQRINIEQALQGCSAAA